VLSSHSSSIFSTLGMEDDVGQKNHGDKRDSEKGTGTHPKTRTASPAAPRVRRSKTPRGTTTRSGDK
jgi:hypothetical protein